MSAKHPLFWIDCEMTGLDPDRDTILEIAALVTDTDLTVLAEGPSLVIHEPESVLAKMDDWNQKHHRQSGLYERVLSSTVTLADAEAQVLAFAKQWSDARKMPLCGNSIWQDRRFLCRHMPKLEAYLHYRIVDVSSLKELVRRWYPQGPEMEKKKEAHRALGDIRESVAELRFYKQHFFVSPALPSGA